VGQARRGYYRAAHYVRPSSVSRQAKKPSVLLVAVVVVLAAIALWNTVFGSGKDQPGTSPRPQSSTASVTPAANGH
jgi:cytoskeletal protein RodZ